MFLDQPNVIIIYNFTSQGKKCVPNTKQSVLKETLEYKP